VYTKKERYIALVELRDTALAAAKLIEEQMILESRFEEDNRKTRKCQESDTVAEYQTSGLQDIEIMHFARRVKELLSRIRGRQARLNLFMAISKQFRVASYSAITREQYPQLLTWLEGFDS
jgi:hypothetical protein